MYKRIIKLDEITYKNFQYFKFHYFKKNNLHDKSDNYNCSNHNIITYLVNKKIL